MSSSKQGFLANYQPSANQLRWLFNVWPTYFAAGVKVEHIEKDFSAARVRLKLGWLNRNYVGTAFGGTLFAMTDPFYMLLLLRRLGAGFLVWDKAASIEFLKPGRGTMRAQFELSSARVEEIRTQALQQGKLDVEFVVEIKDQQQQVIARVRKTIYVRARTSEAR